MVSLCFMPDTVIVILGVLLVVWWFLCACFMSDTVIVILRVLLLLVVWWFLYVSCLILGSLLVVSLFHA